MKLLIATVASLLALAKTVGAVTFDATNTASNTSGGQRFDKAVGVDYAKQVLSNASSFIWYTFNQSTPADRKPVNAVTLVVEDFNGIAVTRNNVIHLSVQYVEGYSGDVKTELTGMLYHEVTLLWQWTGQLEGNGGLLRGIADYVRLKAGYPERHWVKPGQGDKWDQGFDVTAWFLVYCDSLQPGFVAQLNAKMKYGYSDAFFAQILGKGVQQLWQNYKIHVNEGNASVPDGTTPSDSLSRNTSNKRPILLLIVIPVVTTLCLISAISICVWRRTRTRSRLKKTLSCTTYSDDIKEIQAVMLDPLLIRAATDNFAEVNKLGEGGFGQVYKGLLPNGLEVAVKRLSNGSKQGIRELKSELLLVSKLQHRNLVKLIGACIHEEEKLLVYEYIPNKSLDAFIFDDEKRKQLTWETRYKIIYGIARGMVYLHDESRVKVIHRDLKPSNILLEEDMTPKICDFGLARVFEGDHTKDITRRVAGTYGYMAPEYAVLGHVSSKSDVFSFGVIVLEIVTGRRNTTSESMMAEHLLSFVWENWTRGTVKEIVDPSLRHNCAENEALKCIHIGLLCVQENPSDRPSMSNVILMLAGRSPTLPSPSRPAFLFRLDNAHHAHYEGANELQEGSSKYNSSFNKATITELEPR